MLTHLPLDVGRNREAGLPIAHDHVSRNHCELFELDGKVAVRDKGSANGTFVNDQRIADAVSLQHGDKLRIGPLTFQLVYAHGKKKIGSELHLVDEIDLGKDPPKPAPKPPAPRPAARPAPPAPAAASPAPAANGPAAAPVAAAPAPPQPAAPLPAVHTPISEIVAKAAALHEPSEHDTAPSIVMTANARPRAEAAPAPAPDSALPLDLRKTRQADEEEVSEDSQDSRAVMNDGPQAKGGSFVTLSLDDLADDDSLVMRSPIVPAGPSRAAAAAKPTAAAKPSAKADPKPAPKAPPAPVDPAPAAEAEEPANASESSLAFFKSLGERVEAEPAPAFKEKKPSGEKKPAVEKPAAPPKEEPAADSSSDEDDPMAFLRSLE